MEREEFAPYRQRIVKAARGHVLEIGIGSGCNLPHYPKSVDRVTGVEPSRKLLRMAKEATRACDFPVDLVEASAEELPIPDDQIDTVTATWVLCSVRDPSRALQEIRRVLRPDGRFLFVEHGVAPERHMNFLQICLNPVWRRISGGCNLTRQPDALIQSQGLTVHQLQTGYMPGFRPQAYIFEGFATL